ncbi:hypothetical protein NSQ14_13575 [Caldifermentibacillus hisashii]|uniref:hypothetical protein n=1 Tax=Caldifermentibacillus hisashii TaxID=996558 RepID=UPI0031FC75C1
MTTRTDLVVKKVGFPVQNDDEKWSRRQKGRFSASKHDEKRSRRQKSEFSAPKW